MMESSANGVEEVNYRRNPTGAPGGVRFGEAFPEVISFPPRKNPKCLGVFRSFPNFSLFIRKLPTISFSAPRCFTTGGAFRCEALVSRQFCVTKILFVVLCQSSSCHGEVNTGLCSLYVRL